MRNLFDEYVAGNPILMPFFSRAPRDVFATPPAAALWGTGLAEAVGNFGDRLRNSPAGSAAGERPTRNFVVCPRNSIVATGQQPGLFTGPLYTIYKAITAVRLARKLEAASGTPCVPLFWLAADDHDFEEARTAHVLAKAHEPLALTYAPAEPVTGLPLYRVPLEKSLHGLIDEAAAQTPGSEFRHEVAAFLHESLDASDSFADWAARILARLFQGTPLVFFAPQLPAARELARKVIEKELDEPLATTALLNEAGARLRALGFPQQVVKKEGECHFFLEMGGRRRKVLFKEDRYHVPDEDVTCSKDEMRAMLRAAPDRFSPNVVLRCIVQQRLFPVVAYVAGPGEVAYWAELRGVFDRFGLPMPVVYPRARCTLTTTKLNKLQRGLGLTLDDLTRGPEDLVTTVLSRTAKTPARDAVARHRAAIDESLICLADELKPESPQTAATVRMIRELLALRFDRIESDLLRADEVLVSTVKGRVNRLCNTLMPFRKPQERVYTVVSFLFEHGWGLVPRLIEALDIESFAMNEVEL